MTTGLAGALHICYTKGCERSILSNKLRKFHNRFPNVLINCCRNAADALAAGLLNREYDIIFTWDSTNLCQDTVICCQEIEKVPLARHFTPIIPLHSVSFCSVLI